MLLFNQSTMRICVWYVFFYIYDVIIVKSLYIITFLIHEEQIALVRKSMHEE